MNKEEREIRINNTDNYRKAGIMVMIAAIGIALIYACITNNIIVACGIVGAGASMYIMLQIANSICYRLDLLIDKK